MCVIMFFVVVFVFIHAVVIFEPNRITQFGIRCALCQLLCAFLFMWEVKCLSVKLHPENLETGSSK